VIGRTAGPASLALALLIGTDGSAARVPAPAAPAAAAAPPAPTVPSVPAPPAYALVTPGRPMEFPADYGSHPDFRTEWWYVTGWLSTHDGQPLGFQITFFRTKPAIDAANPSAFTPHQVLIAHCALSDPKRGRLWMDQKIRRAGFDLAQASVGDTDIGIDRWTLKRAAGVYHANIDAEDFSMHLELSPRQPPLLNGDSGVSRKGSSPQAASYYYSLPHMSVGGSITRDGRVEAIAGEAWFDHEWSSEYLESGAVGWDWIGINLADGGALMAFRIRAAQGEPRWAAGTWRSAEGKVQVFSPDEVRFEPTRTWQSPRTGTVYPVEWRVQAGPLALNLKPLMDDQENDTRLSTGAVYWEGAVQAYEGQRPIGRGYLELTGYGEPLQLR
jgi:predicted secreted hydrolase